MKDEEQEEDNKEQEKEEEDESKKLTKEGEREGKSVDMNTLSLDQLNDIKSSLEKEIVDVGNSIQTLQGAWERFNESKRAVVALETSQPGQALMVPLTPSMYVRGKLSSVTHVTVDIGTGYFVKMTIPKARDFLQRRLDHIMVNMDKFRGVLEERRDTLQEIVSTMRKKMASASSR
jgi:prefoldin alpha subunit